MKRHKKYSRISNKMDDIKKDGMNEQNKETETKSTEGVFIEQKPIIEASKKEPLLLSEEDFTKSSEECIRTSEENSSETQKKLSDEEQTIMRKYGLLKKKNTVEFSLNKSKKRFDSSDYYMSVHNRKK